MNYIPIRFPKDIVVAQGLVHLKIEIEPPGKRHPYCVVSKSTADDPSSQLAFKLSYHTDSGEEINEYAKAISGKKTVYAGNTLVDFLANRKAPEEIADIPRRYLYYNQEHGAPSEKLQRFVGGGYTDGTPDH